MQRNMTIVVAVVVIVIIIIGGYAAYTLSNQNPPAQPTPTPTPTPAPVVQEQARDASMNYIKTNHPETAELMTNLNWTGGREDTDIVGSETYSWTSEGWQFITFNMVVLDPEYTVTAVYTPLVAGGHTVNWVGTYKGGTVTETSYAYT